MPTFSSGREAKEYLVAQITDEADRDGTPLSETERKMMYFTETAWTLPDIWEVNEVFEREYDQPAYEAKIGRLAKQAHDLAVDADEDKLWNEAVRTLQSEDHYLLVLLAAGKQSTRSFVIDRVKLVLTALLVIALVVFTGIALFSQKN